MDTKIVILGAGYAGVLTAKKLARKLKKKKDVSITIIDKNPFHTMLTELHEVAAGRVDEESIKINLERVFVGRNVDVKHDLINSIDFENRLLEGNKEKYGYDYLVLAAGSKPTYFGVPGAQDNAFKLWSLDDAAKLKTHILDTFRKAAAQIDPALKKRLLTFHIVGAGFTGVELSGEMAEYFPILCDKYEIDPQLVSISVIDVLSRTIPTLPERLSAKAEKRLKKMGIRVLLNTNVVNIGKDSIEIESKGEKSLEASGTIIWAAGIEASEITLKAAQTLKSAKRGRIMLDPYLRSVDDDRVYVAGDNMMYTPEGEDVPVPQVVENCEESADTVAHNIVCAVSKAGEMEKYQPQFHGIMVSIGGRYGVAYVGMPKRMISLPSFFAMFAKHFINILYYVKVLGWNKVFSYVKHEFFTIRNCRSFVGGHLSNRTPSFLLMPLRVFLGAVWVFEGVKKILEGWFLTPKLTGFFKGANAWYDGILNGIPGGAVDGTSAATAAAVVEQTVDAVSSATAAVGVAADAVSSATPAVEGAAEAAASVGTVIMNLNFLGLFRAIFVSGKELINSTLSDFALKLEVPLVNSFIDNLVLPSDSFQMFMQIFIVIAEILIGLALIGGLFTTPASAASLILQAMFVMTTGLYLSTFWMVFAAIALLIGAGRTLGLDYWVMPVLKRKWKNIGWVKKWYLYHD